MITEPFTQVVKALVSVFDVLLAGEDLANHRMVTEERWQVYTIDTAGTHLVCNGAGVLGSVNVIGGTLGDVTGYNAVTATGTPILPTETPAKGNELVKRPLVCDTGITIVTAAATKLVIAFRKDA